MSRFFSFNCDMCYYCFQTTAFLSLLYVKLEENKYELIDSLSFIIF